MNAPSTPEWVFLAGTVGATVGSGLYILPQPWLVVPLVVALLSFIVAGFVLTERSAPAEWPARTLPGERFVVVADADRVLDVAGDALRGAGVQRLERWPSELIASRDSIGGSVHVEVRLRKVSRAVVVDVTSRSDDPVARTDDVVGHVVMALKAM